MADNDDARPELKLSIRQIAIEDLDQLKQFRCGNTSMESYLNQEAYLNHCLGEGITKVVEIDDTHQLIAYYTLKCSEFTIDDENMYSNERKFPCIEISRLAVLSPWQNGQNGIRIGTHLLGYILNFIKDVLAKEIGCKFIVIHAVHEMIKWYEDFGFEAPDGKIPNQYGTVFMLLDITDNEEYLNYIEYINKQSSAN